MYKKTQNLVKQKINHLHNIGGKFRRVNTTGFAILYVMIIIAIILAVSLATINLINKEQALARVARESLNARSSADTGLECMLSTDKYPGQFNPSNYSAPFTINCGRDNSGNAVSYTVTCLSSCSTTGNYAYSVKATSYGSVNGPCFEADLTRTIGTSPAPDTTKINIFGYNTCLNSKIGQQVQRGIIIDY